MRKTFLLTTLFCFFLMQNGYSQVQDELVQRRIIDNFLSNQQSKLELTNSDVKNWKITSQSTSKLSNVNYVYIQQTYKGIPVYNAVANFSIKNGEVLNYSVSFLKDISSKANTTQPNISAEDAIKKAANQLGLEFTGQLELIEKKNGNIYMYENETLSSEKIPVELIYQPLEDGTLVLAWQLYIDQLDGKHSWNLRIDASNGTVLDKNDLIVRCSFDLPHSHEKQNKLNNTSLVSKKKEELLPLAGERYNVFAIPVESPIHGPRSIVTEPHNIVASPFGWHDTDGVAGPEYTITRGNNVYAQLDDDKNNSTFGFAPDGGATLNFDFPYLFGALTEANIDSGLTNLFYMNNIMHDIYYQYGFDEQAGNFQQNNYGKGGSGGDYVIADSQDASGRNNANFRTLPDGTSPRMQMFLWDPLELFHINTGTLMGAYVSYDSYFTLLPNSQGPVTGTFTYEQPVTADLAIVNDGTNAPAEACQPITNVAEVTGKIAVIRRGNCNYTVKIKNAENAGAIGAVVVNNGNDVPGLGGPTPGIGIPAVIIPSTEEGEAIITALEGGEVINASLKSERGPDSSFDNGIIAHEYGHGVSIRLVGGSNNTSCLNNDEQMGEGWSDFLGLVITMKEGDQPEDRRGVGTYSVIQETTGRGIRRYPYSTDRTINPFTFKDTNDTSNSKPHGIGSIWATMLWDLTWAMIEEYGFDPDFYNGTGGNNKAMALVIEGLKNTSCNPGFVAGRNAILTADELLYNGENKCKIWEVFAARGLGYSASSGSTNNARDQVEAFDMPPASELNCELAVEEIALEELKITPNPSNGNFTIITSKNLGKVNTSIYSMDGKLVHTESVNLNKNATINASALNTGVYVLKIKGNGFERSEKLIIK